MIPAPRTRTLIHAAPLRRPFPVATADAFDEPDLYGPESRPDFDEEDDEDAGPTHPHMPNFKDQPPIYGALVYDKFGQPEDQLEAVEVGVIANVSTNPALPPHRIVITIAGGCSLCLTLAQSEELRAKLALAELDAAPALALVGLR